MMLVSMRMQKSQITTTSWKWTAGMSGTFKKALYLMAGFTKFEVMIVGGGGGMSGNANATGFGFWGCGGAGGGGQYRRGYLTNLTDLSSWGVGQLGGPGTNQLADQDNGHGGKGGTSFFGAWSCTGGTGGQNAVLWSSGGYSSYYTSFSGFPNVGNIGASNGTYPEVAPAQAGTLVNVSGDAESPEQVIGMSGGGGGSGRWSKTSSPAYVISTEADGAPGAGGAYSCPAVPATHLQRGGGGGGVNVAPFTGGAAEYYGRGAGGTTPALPGIVMLRVS